MEKEIEWERNREKETRRKLRLLLRDTTIWSTGIQKQRYAHTMLPACLPAGKTILLCTNEMHKLCDSNFSKVHYEARFALRMRFAEWNTCLTQQNMALSKTHRRRKSKQTSEKKNNIQMQRRNYTSNPILLRGRTCGKLCKLDDSK